ncbi:MAG: hypothetical protein JO157_10460 [Acetobacteraceae bacterium]|nr:hypothetical protein [Acetobacteraceae bacterium]
MISRHYAALLLIVGAVLAHRAARAQDAAQPTSFCGSVGVDDTLRPIPASLVPAAARLFSLRAPASYVQRTTVFRCMDGTVLVCNTGANLPCEKANTNRDLPGAIQYCSEHPDSSFIPMFVTGHNTIYRWRCEGTTADAGEPVERVDTRGFVARLWKPVG